MARSFKLGVAQSPAALDTPGGRVDWLAARLPNLADEGVDLLLLPELFLTGYNVGDAIADRAEPCDGPMAGTISGLARQYGIALHYGFAEEADGLLYNAAQCFGPDGDRLGGHRKLVLPPGFEADHFTPGHGCGAFTLKGVRFATLICYDAEFPEAARHVAATGAEVVLVPTALGAQWGWVSRSMIPTRGYENGVFLAYANQAGEENSMAYLGESFISAPDGEELVRAGASPEILIADLDMKRVGRAQARLPYLGDRLKLDLGGE